MIPKIIHFCWLSGDEYPELIKKCMTTWKEKLPDYEFILWDTNRFDIKNNTWVKQAFEAKKYAFAADYIRLHAVYTHGGIYLDTDIEVIKSFNPLLHLPYFMGSEGETIIEAGVFGAEKGTSWLSDCLKHYDNRTFIKKDGTYEIYTLPRIMMKQLNINHTINNLKLKDLHNVSYKYPSTNLYMFPSEFFCAKDHGTGAVTKTENTFSIHHFAMSWLPKSEALLPNIKRRLMKIFGVKVINKIIKITGLGKLRNNYE